jgi:hypothetical protein
MNFRSKNDGPIEELDTEESAKSEKEKKERGKTPVEE